MRFLLPLTCSLAVFATLPAWADTSCAGTTLTGVVVDGTLALIPEATLTLDGVRHETSGSDGRFRFNCVADGPHRIEAKAAGFSGRELPVSVPHAAVELVLQPEAVETKLDVDANETDTSVTASSVSTRTISGRQLDSLADDPDDLLRELQQLAATSGSNPASATITVDGFQGDSKLPPKSSIAYIKVNPDLFSSEYRQPPFQGGRIEVYTKPGQSANHGALFATNGSPFMNARDPFSVSKAPIGKQRYGFELSGPVRRVGSDFAMALEHRSIDNFAVVNAITLDGAGDPVSTVANVATPQRLWVGTARLDWQLGARNTLIGSYSENVNQLQNVGVGGTALAESAYDSGQYEHVIRLTDVTTISARLMHEARVSLKWDGETDTPISTAPQLQVAGAFTGGGANLGAQRLHEFNVEVDDDAILSTKHHLLKFGTQIQTFDEHQQLTTNFNGTYIFGGGTAPALDASGQPIAAGTASITGLEQYRRALLGLPGGTATAYSGVTGNPEVDFTKVRASFFVQDDWKLRHNVMISSGMRYSMETEPTVLNGATPRVGIAWTPDKAAKWTLHAHAGLFTGIYPESVFAEVRRMDGVARVTSTVYSPAYGNPLVGATPVHSVRALSPHLSNLGISIENVGVTHALPRGWNLSADAYLARIWNYTRTENVNSLFTDSPTGPRPGAANLNVLQMQNSGQGRANVQSVGVEQHAFKRVQFFLGAVRVDLVDDTDDSALFTPQSSVSNVGEFARRTNNPLWQIFGNGTLKLPGKLQLSGDLQGAGGAAYNVTTGFDNNGDGNFNDRPTYGQRGDPNAISTPFGLLVASGGTGVFPRNKGRMPWTVHLDTNVSRTFQMTHGKRTHEQALVLNVRSSNVLNHTNVTGIGGVLGSPLFGVPYTADNGRRIEAGVRYSF